MKIGLRWDGLFRSHYKRIHPFPVETQENLKTTASPMNLCEYKSASRERGPGGRLRLPSGG
jgi:hypothetical protein